MGTPSIVVLTPVKNEAWILPRFLATTSVWADLIILADQHSSDESVRICKGYTNVVAIENRGDSYDEAGRQLLLIEEARKRILGPKILLALDADEILAADAVGSTDWRAMLAAPAGTVLLFEKPDLLPGTLRCIRYPDNPQRLGFVDDGTSRHHPRRIHSVRIPTPDGAPELRLPGIKILHYGLVREETQMAKVRYYALQENLAGTNPIYRRRRYYGRFRRSLAEGIARSAGPVSKSWFAGWEERGIEMRNVHEDAFPWQEVEVLRSLDQHGARRFWLDAIWDIDWEQRRQLALRLGFTSVGAKAVTPPSLVYRALASIIDFGSWLLDCLRSSRAPSS